MGSVQSPEDRRRDALRPETGRESGVAHVAGRSAATPRPEARARLFFTKSSYDGVNLVASRGLRLYIVLLLQHEPRRRCVPRCAHPSPN
eukprot:7379715-Prymnesium_polylepis.2